MLAVPVSNDLPYVSTIITKTSSTADHSFTCSYSAKRYSARASDSARFGTTATLKTLNSTSHIALRNSDGSRSTTRYQPSVSGVTVHRPPGVVTANISQDASTSFGDIPAPDHSVQQLSPAPVFERADGSQEAADQPQQEADGLGEVNRHTEGAEFYGPTGTFYFLSRLQSQANAQNLRHESRDTREQSSGRGLNGTSVVNLLHSSDYPVSKFSTGTDTSQRTGWSAGQVDSHAATEAEIARECVQLYFQNLHCIHPILDRDVFLVRCEREVWNDPSHNNGDTVVKTQAQNRFRALFSAVLAIGAITAGETSMLTWTSTVRFLDQHEGCDNSGTSTTTYPPIRVARLFFGKCKQYLGDIFESSSFETAQTLFLMVRDSYYTKG